MPRGSRPGERRGGRQRGTPNKRTAALQEAVQAAAERFGVANGLDTDTRDAHALLVAVYQDTRLPIEERVDAAVKAMIPFEKPRLRAQRTSPDPLAQLTVHQEQAVQQLADQAARSGTSSAPSFTKPHIRPPAQAACT